MEKHRMKDEGFRVDTPEQAAWAMRKYRRLAQKKAQYAALAEAERHRIQAWEERVSASVQSNMDFFGSHLEAYAIRERARGAKSVEFPDGSIKTRQTGASYEVDRAVFVDWASEAKRDDLLRVTLAPDMTAIKSAVVVDGGQVLDPSTGEVIPGLAPTPERVSVKIEPDLEAVDLDDIEDEVDDDDSDI
jgi:hypothetical protein